MARDIEALQGRWNITALEMDGAEMPAPTFTGAGITVDGDRFISTGMGLSYEGTVVIDHAKKPKTLDLLFTVGHAAGTRNFGIYELKRDRWTICLATRGTRRPRAFATRADTGLALETLKRAVTNGRTSNRRTKAVVTQKPSALPRAVRGRTLGATSTGSPTGKSPDATTPWEGEWKMVSGIFSGVPMAENMVEWVKRETRGDVTKVLAGPQTMLHARFTLDESKRPNLVEYSNLSGTNKGKTQSGIAEFTGDALRVCVAAPGKPRPDGFSSKKGDGRSLTTWRLERR